MSLILGALIGYVLGAIPFGLIIGRVTRGIDSCHPNPNGPLPFPELYCSDNVGPNPPRPGDTAIGMVWLPVPSNRLA